MNASSPRNAISDRRDEIAALPRPSVLGGAASQDVLTQETADLFKVYRPEWIVVAVSDAPGDAGRKELEAMFAERWEGRVFQEDVLLEPGSEKFPDKYAWRLRLLLWNVRGEFKWLVKAQEFVTKQGWSDSARVVIRNSREEFQLREYGQKKLPEGADRGRRFAVA